MKDESEGVKIENIEKIYNDKEDESKYPLATSTIVLFSFSRHSYAKKLENVHMQSTCKNNEDIDI